MKLTFIWRYPDETRYHTAKYYDIDPNSIKINNGYFYFAKREDIEDAHWQFPVDHIVSMETEEE